MKARANGVELEYETRGDPANPTLLLIMGFTAQLAHWPDAFLDALATRGFHVVVFDNRDIGLSTHLDHLGRPDVAAIYQGKAKAPYALEDMAADAVGLLDALGVAKAHVMGMSMGGLIAQLISALHPERVLSLTIVMSTTSSPNVPPPKPEVMQIMGLPPAGADLEAATDWSVRLWSTIGSPGHDYATPAGRERLAKVMARSHSFDGAARQSAAIMATGDTRRHLARVTAPTVVIHGEDDPLIPVAGGRDIADNIEGAKLVTIPGMGHDFPPHAFDRIASEIAKVAEQAR